MRYIAKIAVMKSRIIIFVVLLFLACKDDEPGITEADLTIYVDRFYAEAAARNLTIDRSTLIVKFVEPSEISPYTGIGTTDPPLVRIVRDYWVTFSDIQKEVLMFHELGHAVLRRTHTNEKLPNCDYKSLMMEGDMYVLYDSLAERRKYYVDELFNPFTAYPSWGGEIKPTGARVLDDAIDNQNDWIFRNVLDATHAGTVDTEVYSSAPNSLHIKSNGVARGMAYWHLPIPFTNFPVGCSLVLSFKIKTQNVTGVGAYAFLEGDRTKERFFYTTTLNYNNITGTRDWTEMQLMLNCYPSALPDMSVDLYLDGAANGDVWFDDVRVDYFN